MIPPRQSFDRVPPLSRIDGLSNYFWIDPQPASVTSA
jgi:hypothetical protein